PKKDQCDHSTEYKNKATADQKRTREEYHLHLLRKEEARDHKYNDKDKAKADSSFAVFAMDMEKYWLNLP
ncbi:hypothetical protein ILUMI_10326, partial [Ignelater luminosus]